MDVHAFLKALTVVLCTAGVTTVLFHRLRQPVVLGYILAGLIVGPHVPIPLRADRAIVQTLSEVGVILLMFSLGLEFSLRKLVRVGPTAAVTGIVQCSLMLWLGFVAGQAFGWTTRESVFCGAIVAISSTTIIAKAFDEQKIKGKLRELVVGVLIVEDLIAILLMAALTTVSAGDGLSASALALASARLAGFLVALLAVGMLVVPRAMRAVVGLGRPETTLVFSIGICFAIAYIAMTLGYSVALGAFIAGSLIAESGHEKEVEHRVEPVRDMFAAIFFVSVGMLIDPQLIFRHAGAIAVLTVLVIVGKVVSVSIGAFLTGCGTRTSVQAGMSLAQIGEFSFIIAALGTSLGATGDFLYPVTVAVSAITTLTTPWLIRASEPVALLVDRKLPEPLQNFAALYGSWVERLRMAPRRDTAGAAARRAVKLLLLDATLLGALLIGVSLAESTILHFANQTLELPTAVGRALLLGALLLLAAPFCFGILRLARRLGTILARAALPERSDGQLDLAAAPRGALVVTLQLGIVLLVGLPLLAVTQPFLGGIRGPLVLAGLLVLLGIGFWRSATNLQGHIKAGAEIIVESLRTQASKGRVRSAHEDSLLQIQRLLPGLGEPVPFRLAPGSACIGKSLAELNVRGRTGATLLAIARGEAGVVAPTAEEVLCAGDVVALAGTHEAVDAAKELLGRPSAAQASPNC